jgi:predicted signal transduction protein with EAL and GGDEF domain
VLVLWELSDVDGVEILVSKVLKTLSQPYYINEQTVHMSASAGVSIYPIHSEDLEVLIKMADMALYESKHLGQNGGCK